ERLSTTGIFCLCLAELTAERLFTANIAKSTRNINACLAIRKILSIGIRMLFLSTFLRMTFFLRYRTGIRYSHYSNIWPSQYPMQMLLCREAPPDVQLLFDPEVSSGLG